MTKTLTELLIEGKNLKRRDTGKFVLAVPIGYPMPLPFILVSDKSGKFTGDVIALTKPTIYDTYNTPEDLEEYIEMKKREHSYSESECREIRRAWRWLRDRTVVICDSVYVHRSEFEKAVLKHSFGNANAFVLGQNQWDDFAIQYYKMLRKFKE